ERRARALGEHTGQRSRQPGALDLLPRRRCPVSKRLAILDARHELLGVQPIEHPRGRRVDEPERDTDSLVQLAHGYRVDNSDLPKGPIPRWQDAVSHCNLLLYRMIPK